MLNDPQLISFRVPDLAAARRWYAEVLGREPVLDSPLAVAFRLDSRTLLLLPRDPSATGEQACVAYFEVDDIEAAYSRLQAAGAVPRSEITFTLMRSRMARLADPFGNVLGILSAAEAAKPVDARPSESAMTVAFSRALAAHDDREGRRGPDHLAEVFLNEEGRRPLDDRTAREWILQKLAGTHEYFLVRTRYLDRVFTDALAAGTPQIVLLGAGYDSRACRFGSRLGETRVFELDVAPTQERKRAMLARAGVAEPPQLVYVTLDFETDSLAERLTTAGFDPARRTLFLWEGVMYYLTARAVDETLAALGRLAPAGSTLAFDYMLQAPDLMERYAVKTVFEAWRNAYSGEPVRFGIEEGTIAAFLAARGFELIEHLGPAEQEQRFLAGADGRPVARVVALFALGLARSAGA